jgi:hypothetical protein
MVFGSGVIGYINDRNQYRADLPNVLDDVPTASVNSMSALGKDNDRDCLSP